MCHIERSRLANHVSMDMWQNTSTRRCDRPHQQTTSARTCGRSTLVNLVRRDVWKTTPVMTCGIIKHWQVSSGFIFSVMWKSQIWVTHGNYLIRDMSPSDVSSYVTSGIFFLKFLPSHSPNVPKSRMSKTWSGHKMFDQKITWGAFSSVNLLQWKDECKV